MTFPRAKHAGVSLDLGEPVGQPVGETVGEPVKPAEVDAFEALSKLRIYPFAEELGAFVVAQMSTSNAQKPHKRIRQFEVLGQLIRRARPTPQELAELLGVGP